MNLHVTVSVGVACLLLSPLAGIFAGVGFAFGDLEHNPFWSYFVFSIFILFSIIEIASLIRNGKVKKNILWQREWFQAIDADLVSYLKTNFINGLNASSPWYQVLQSSGKNDNKIIQAVVCHRLFLIADFLLFSHGMKRDDAIRLFESLINNLGYDKTALNNFMNRKRYYHDIDSSLFVNDIFSLTAGNGVIDGMLMKKTIAELLEADAEVLKSNLLKRRLVISKEAMSTKMFAPFLMRWGMNIVFIVILPFFAYYAVLVSLRDTLPWLRAGVANNRILANIDSLGLAENGERMMLKNEPEFIYDIGEFDEICKEAEDEKVVFGCFLPSSDRIIIRTFDYRLSGFEKSTLAHEFLHYIYKIDPPDAKVRGALVAYHETASDDFKKRMSSYDDLDYDGFVNELHSIVPTKGKIDANSILNKYYKKYFKNPVALSDVYAKNKAWLNDKEAQVTNEINNAEACFAEADRIYQNHVWAARSGYYNANNLYKNYENKHAYCNILVDIADRNIADYGRLMNSYLGVDINKIPTRAKR